ncbi:MAG: hypothetical protein LW650_09270 [Planctomycetaceae bacterium]|nr:hypothetical protein [Phycisphaerales bacterium]MCE2653665.1 hypothetical protein [Planctomycetaceae bacterium]
MRGNALNNTWRRIVSLVAIAGLPAWASAQPVQSTAEIEPNETKGNATLTPELPLSGGPALTGFTLGSNLSPGVPSSADTFRLRVAGAGNTTPTIYRHRLVGNEDGPPFSWSMTIRGLRQSRLPSGEVVILPETDDQLQRTLGTVWAGVVERTRFDAQTVLLRLPPEFRCLTEPTGNCSASEQAQKALDVLNRFAMPARTLQWYGFGRPHELFVRIEGTSSTNALYSMKLSSEAVTPLPVAQELAPGEIYIGIDRAGIPLSVQNDPNIPDTRWQEALLTSLAVYDENLNPIPGFSNDDPRPDMPHPGFDPADPTVTPAGWPANTPYPALAAALRRTFAPGVYYIAYARDPLAYNLASPGDDNNLSRRTDFADLLVPGSSTLPPTDPLQPTVEPGQPTPPPRRLPWYTNLRLIDSAGSTVSLRQVMGGPYHVNWYRLTVQSTTNFTANGVAFPDLVARGDSTLLTVDLRLVPPATSLPPIASVTADLRALGGAQNAIMRDDGVGGDLAAGDNIYSLAVNIAPSQTVGLAQIPFTVTEAPPLNATTSGTLSLRVFGVPAATELGTLSAATTTLERTADPLAANGVRWYTFTSLVGVGPAAFLDLTTAGSNLGPVNDTRIALYGSNGLPLYTNDDGGRSSGPSLLSFGQPTLTRRYGPPDMEGAGQDDGTLPPGRYYVAVVGGPLSTFGPGFSVSSVSGNAGNVRLSVLTNSSSPRAVGTASPPVLFRALPRPVRLQVAVTPADRPFAGIGSVTADLSAIGLSTTEPLLDNGVPPDAAAGDLIFTREVDLGGQVVGGLVFPYLVTDALNRTAAGTISVQVTQYEDLGVVEQGRQGALTRTINSVPTGTVEWYRLLVRRPVPEDGGKYIDIHTIGSDLSPVNSLSLALYDAAGSVVAINTRWPGVVTELGGLSFGDSPGGSQQIPARSYVDGAQNWTMESNFGSLSAGTYYLAITPGDLTLWGGDFIVVPATENSGTVRFAILTNLASPACLADVSGIGGPGSEPDGLLTGDDFVTFVGAFSTGDPLADIVGIGGAGTEPDGVVSGDDFNAFIASFAAGCP